MNVARAIRGIALDMALWYCVPALFMVIYVDYYSQPSAAVAPHLSLVALPLAGVSVMRLILSRAIRHVTARRLIVGLVVSSLLALLMTYYCLVLVGLRSWGGVVAMNVIPTFFSQATVLADALSVPLAVFPIAAILLYVGLLAACWLYLERFDWIGALAIRASLPTIAAIASCVLAIVAIRLYDFASGRWIQVSEPVSLTLFSKAGALDLEGYSVNPVTASRLDQLADRARSGYVPAAAGNRNLVLVVVDALRPDHMGIYGYQRDTTPNLSRITRVNYSRMVRGVHSSCGDTICALFSMFSSNFPSEFSFRPFTLQEALRRNGYRIHMVLSGDHTYFHSLRSLYGQVDSFYDGTQARGYFINDDQLVLDRVAGMPDSDGRPVMLQIHLMSAHILHKSDDVPGKFQPASRYALRNSKESGPGGETPQSAVNFYDNGVLQSDRIIAALLQLLQNKGYLRDALVVITADHGESLGEHGLFTHANSVREELLSIPLVLISFGYEPRAHGPARAFPSQIDIAPTILADLGMPLPDTWAGRSVDEPTGPGFSYFEEQSFAGLIDHRDPAHAWKYWTDRRSGIEHVFDLNVDPHEDRDVLARLEPEEINAMRNAVRTGAAAGLQAR